MTIFTSSNSVVYRGNGAATQFAVPFKVLELNDLVVCRRIYTTGEVDRTYLGTEYSYSGLGEVSGVLTLSGAALADTYELLIERIVSYTQELDIVNSGGFYPETTEEQLDRMVMGIQQIASMASRSLRVPIGTTIDEVITAGNEGKFFGLDANGVPMLMEGTGSDAGLRTDLAGNSGFSLLGWIRANTIGAIKRALSDIIDDMPLTLQDFGAVANADYNVLTGVITAGTPCDDAWTAAMAHFTARGNGILRIRGKLFHSTALAAIPAGVTIQGKNEREAMLLSTHAGGGIKTNFAVNGSHRANITLERFAIINTNPANTGIGFYERCGTFLDCSKLWIRGFKYNMALDQTEVSAFRDFILELPLASNLLLMNGYEVGYGNDPATVPLFTNRLLFDSFQLNGAPHFCVEHDGGYCAELRSCNYNGGELGQVRAAGIAPLKIDGGEFEVASGPIITMAATTQSGRAVGQPIVSIDNVLLAPTHPTHTPGNSINIVSGYMLHLGAGVVFGTTGAAGTPQITGGANLNRLIDLGCDMQNSTGPLFLDNDRPTNWFSLTLDEKGEKVADGGARRMEIMRWARRGGTGAGGISRRSAEHVFYDDLAATLTGAIGGARTAPSADFEGEIVISANAPGAAAAALASLTEVARFRYNKWLPGADQVFSLGDINNQFTNAYVFTGYYVSGIKVVGAQGAAVANAAVAVAAPTKAEFDALVGSFNTVLARLRAHGLIAT